VPDVQGVCFQEKAGIVRSLEDARFLVETGD
jgi:hypothetical protein